MDKKEMNVKFLLLLMFILSIMNSYSQRLYTENLDWKQKKGAVNELYELMQHFVNDTTPILVQHRKPDFFQLSLFDLFYGLFNDKKINNQIKLQKQIRQNEIKNYIDSNFVIINDSVESFIFKDKNQIIEWAKKIYFNSIVQESAVLSVGFRIKGNNIFLVMIDSCSGISCLSVFIFKEKGDIWELQTTSEARIKEKLNIRVDNNQEKMIFEIPSGQIGELPFKILLQ